MNDTDRKFLTEQMGECWHNRLTSTKYCTNRTFTTWTDFGAVWEWAKGQKWWSLFLMTEGFFPQDGHEDGSWLNETIDPLSFPQLVVNFLKRR